MRVLILLLLAAAAVSAQTRSGAPSAATPNVAVVVVESGAGRRQPIARVQDGRWEATCEMPGNGIVLSLQTPRRVTPQSGEWKSVEPLVRDTFERREREQRVGIARTSRVPVVLESLYASGPAGEAIYYFEASKRVEDANANANADPDTDPAGLLRIRVTGWLRADRRSVTVIASKADLQWEQLDRAAATVPPDLVPVGTFARDGAVIWVMRRETSAAPTFMLYQIRESAVAMLLRSQC